MIYNVTTGKTYESIADAARATGVNPGSISRASRGLRQSAGGYQWAQATTAAEKRAATRAAKKAAGSLTEAQRERREWQRGLSEAKIAARKAAEKEAKRKAAEEERARKAAERERKRAEREHKQAAADARRAIKHLRRQRKEAGLSKKSQAIIDQTMEEIGVGDLSELLEMSSDALHGIATAANQAFERVAATDGKEDIGRIMYLFGLKQQDAERMQYELRELLRAFGEVREFLLRVQGDTGYQQINLKSEYRKVITMSGRMTPENIMQIVKGMRDYIKDFNSAKSKDLSKVIGEWREEVGYGRTKQRKPIKPR